MNAIDFPTPTGPRSTPDAQRRALTTVPPGATLKVLAAATAVALLVLSDARPVHAQSLGELDVRSRLGEPFFAAVPVQNAGILDPRCIRVVPSPTAPSGAEALQGTRIRIGSADSVIIETAGTVTSPIVGLRLEVGCDNPVSRDYLVLGEGATVAGAPAAIADAAPSAEVAAVSPTGSQQAGTPAPARARPARVSPVRQAASERSAGGSARAERRAAPAPASAAQTTAAVPSPAATPSQPAAAVPVAPKAQSAATRAGTASSGASDAARRVAELRARSDDHAAALLALDDRLALLQKQAEVLKAQLEQVLAAAPASASSAGASASPAAAAAPVAPTVAVARPSAVAPATTPAASAASAAGPERSVFDLITDWRVAGGLTALLLGAFAFTLRRRPTFKAAEPPTYGVKPRATASLQQRPIGTEPATVPGSLAYEHEKTQEVRPVQFSTAADKTLEWQSAPHPPLVDQTAEWVAPPTTDTLPVPESGEGAAAKPRLPGVGISREFHITQQFQPGAERVVALSSPEEIVQQARNHYMEDGDVFRAIDLLEMAVAARKDSPRPWQALFAIYRRENMPERFQRLVLAYRSAFGQDANWPAIRSLGYAIDPENPLYAGEEPAEPLPEDLVERWLGVPLDFTAHLLANEMHDQLMDTFPGRKRRKRLAHE